MDVGVTNLVAYSNGTFSENPRHFQRSQERLANAQRILARAKRGSNRRAKQVQRVASIHRKIAHQRKDYVHKLTTTLVENHAIIVHENLNITGMVRGNRGLNRSILDAEWGMLFNQLMWKAEDAAREVIKVNPRHTSQTCHECGHVARENRNGERFNCVRCGHKAHADLNAAKNILRAGLVRHATRV